MVPPLAPDPILDPIPPDLVPPDVEAPEPMLDPKPPPLLEADPDVLDFPVLVKSSGISI